MVVKNPPAKSRLPSGETTRLMTEPTVTVAAAPVPAVVPVPGPGLKASTRLPVSVTAAMPARATPRTVEKSPPM